MSVTNSSSKHSTRVLLRDPVGDQLERIGLVLVLLQLVVHRLHEAMEVAALLVRERQALEEQVHQPGLAAADAAPDVQAALQLRALAAATAGRPAACVPSSALAGLRARDQRALRRSIEAARRRVSAATGCGLGSRRSSALRAA